MTVNEPITSGQEKQYRRFVEDAAVLALKEVGLDKDGIQRLIGHGGDFQTDIVASVRKHSSHSVGAPHSMQCERGVAKV